MPIRVLDAHTAELIAAGEVVERPSSVVKELLENTIDAGATQAEVEIERGGTALIRVQDNGKGIPAGEVPLAFLRHATSKVQTQADLEAISTLGFRGEALASIASVARVELLTHAVEEENACYYRMEGGVEQELSEAARPLGTTFTVRELFYNTPARMKFLKKDVSEAAYVTETVGRLALSHPALSLRYLRDGKEQFHTPGDGQLVSAVHAVLGREFAAGLLAVEGGRPPYAVQGFVTQPRAGRGSRSLQFFFLNGRFVKNRTMMAALEQAYRGSSMQGKFPGCVLFLQMPPELVDVNVHPAKTEVRFARENDVFAAVYAAVKEALAAGEAKHGGLRLEGPKDGPAGQAAPATLRQEPPTGTKPVGAAVAASPPPRRPAFGAPMPPPGPLSPKAPPQQERGQAESLASSAEFIPYQTMAQTRLAPPPVVREYGLDVQPEEEVPLPRAPLAPEAPLPKGEDAVDAAERDEEALRYVGEVFATYILAQRGETMFVIDKHAAHERMLYEKLEQERLEAGSQQLLAPVAVQLGAREKEALLENQAVLAASGIELEDFGAGGVVVRAVPADIVHTDIEGLVAEVAKGLAAGSRQVRDKKTEWVLHSMACRAAVKGGDKTPPQQLLHLAQQILSGAVPPFCPHGRPVVLEITRKELEKQFGRLG